MSSKVNTSIVMMYAVTNYTIKFMCVYNSYVYNSSCLKNSATAWNDFKRRHTLATHKQFPGYLCVEDIGMALEKLNVRYVRLV
jgi:spermidine/putrescine-binding protein